VGPKLSQSVLKANRAPPNTRLKLTARVDYGMNLTLARRSLSAIREATTKIEVYQVCVGSASAH